MYVKVCGAVEQDEKSSFFLPPEFRRLPENFQRGLEIERRSFCKDL